MAIIPLTLISKSCNFSSNLVEAGIEAIDFKKCEYSEVDKSVFPSLSIATDYILISGCAKLFNLTES